MSGLTNRCWRDVQVDELTQQFIARGVSKHTARAWAEAETPRDIVLTNCTFWYTSTAMERMA